MRLKVAVAWIDKRIGVVALAVFVTVICVSGTLWRTEFRKDGLNLLLHEASTIVVDHWCRGLDGTVVGVRDGHCSVGQLLVAEFIYKSGATRHTALFALIRRRRARACEAGKGAIVEVAVCLVACEKRTANLL